MRRLCTILALMLILSTPALLADYRDPAYKGKVYVEISIDDDGIVLIDSAGNVTEISTYDAENETRGERSQDRVEDPLLVDCRKVMGEINKIGGSVIISEDECVDGDVVVVGGNAIVRGRVAGSVTATGWVRVTATATIRGDVTAGEEVIAEPGSVIMGKTNTRFPRPPIPTKPSGALVMFLLIAVQLTAILLVSLLFQKATDRLTEVYRQNIFKALAIGFLAEILLLPAFILLLITIIGIPVAVIGLPLAVIGAALLGMAAFSLYVSDFTRSKHDAGEESRLMKTLTGFVILEAPIVALFFFRMINADLAAILFGIVAGILVFIVFTSSLGAAILTRFGSRDYSGGGDQVGVRVEVIDSQGKE